MILFQIQLSIEKRQTFVMSHNLTSIFVIIKQNIDLLIIIMIDDFQSNRRKMDKLQYFIQILKLNW